MPLNKSTGNMYEFITHTWNTIKGECPHGCSYCYMKRWGKQPPVHFDEKELKTDLGKNNFIFYSCIGEIKPKLMKDMQTYIVFIPEYEGSDTENFLKENLPEATVEKVTDNNLSLLSD